MKILNTKEYYETYGDRPANVKVNLCFVCGGAGYVVTGTQSDREEICPACAGEKYIYNLVPVKRP